MTSLINSGSSFWAPKATSAVVRAKADQEIQVGSTARVEVVGELEGMMHESSPSDLVVVTPVESTDRYLKKSPAQSLIVPRRTKSAEEFGYRKPISVWVANPTDEPIQISKGDAIATIIILTHRSF